MSRTGLIGEIAPRADGGHTNLSCTSYSPVIQDCSVFEKKVGLARFYCPLFFIPLSNMKPDLQFNGLAIPWWLWIGSGAICLLGTVLIVGLVVERFWQTGAQRKGHERLLFGELISNVSTQLEECPSDEIDTKIERSLKAILDFYGRDRCWLMDIDDNKEVKVLYACDSLGIEPVPKESNLAVLFPWTFDTILRHRKHVCFRSFDELPPESEEDKCTWTAKGVKSSLNIPVTVNERVRYVFVMESTRQECLWPPEIISQLRLIGELFANALTRRDTDHALRESESRFNELADNAPILIWCSGPDKQCFYFNKTWLKFVGRSLEEELGSGWTDNVHPDDRKKCLSDYLVAFDARVEFELEYRLRRFDGVYRLISDRGMPRFDSNSQFLGYIGSCVDITDLKVAERTLQDMSGRLIEAQEEERSRIARELHDDISQRMALLLIELDKMKCRLPSGTGRSTQLLSEIMDAANGISSDIHNLSHQLHPSKLEILGLVAAVNGYCHELSAQHALQIKFTHTEDPRNLRKEITLCLYRIVQEALQNVVKHSGVKHATVELKFYPDEIYLCVSDSGEGFNVKRMNPDQGLGLISMRERLRLVHGKLSVQSMASKGTQIEVWIPVAESVDRPSKNLKVAGSEAHL